MVKARTMDSLAQVDRVECTSTFPVKHEAIVRDLSEYHRLYEQSIQQPGKFWEKVARDFYWCTPLPSNLETIFKYNFDPRKGPVVIEFLKGIKTNICYNLLDRIINKGFGDRIAYFWEGNEENEKRQVTYSELLADVNRFANVLKAKGVGVNDRVAIYLPVTIELVVAMLACARIGAVHTVVFAGFSAVSLSERMIDARCKLLVTGDATFRGEKFLHIQAIIDEAVVRSLERGLDLLAVVVVQLFKTSLYPDKAQYESIVNNFEPRPSGGVYHFWSDLMATSDSQCSPAWLDGEHSLFILYTSGSTGKPKGVVHTVAGYMLTTALVFRHAFNYCEGDIFFCTADLGWITGHTANVYGALANGATSLLYEGIPTYPQPDRFWSLIHRYGVNIFYTAPTAIRALMKFDESYIYRHTMAQLKLLALVGEPINKEAWFWLFRHVGKQRCPIVDTYFQTETGAPMIFPLAGCVDMKPGSATLPFFAIRPVILSDDGNEISGTQAGFLAFSQAWPGMARTVDGDHARFESTYFERFPGYYFTGDAAFRDNDGYFWITGRTDDLLNVSGHLLSTAEVESVILSDSRISEVAAVAMPHAIKGQCICVYVVTKDAFVYDQQMQNDLTNIIRKKIGPLATPDLILAVRGLPKTRSGKILRRVLAKIARGEPDFGDISTITDETIIPDLIAARRQHD